MSVFLLDTGDYSQEKKRVLLASFGEDYSYFFFTTTWKTYLKETQFSCRFFLNSLHFHTR